MSGLPGVGRKLGTQPRWVHTASITANSDRLERRALRADSGCSDRRDCGSASRASCRASASIISGVRRSTNTGLPRHSTVRSSPGRRLARSTSTGAPSARAFSLGASEATKGTAVATNPAPPATVAAPSQSRRSASSGEPAERTEFVTIVSRRAVLRCGPRSSSGCLLHALASLRQPRRGCPGRERSAACARRRSRTRRRSARASRVLP